MGRWLGWEKFAVRGLVTRALLEWDSFKAWDLRESNARVRVIPGSDGPLASVVARACKAVDELGARP